MTELRGINRKNSFYIIVNCSSVFKKKSIGYVLLLNKPLPSPPLTTLIYVKFHSLYRSPPPLYTHTYQQFV